MNLSTKTTKSINFTKIFIQLITKNILFINIYFCKDAVIYQNRKILVKPKEQMDGHTEQGDDEKFIFICPNQEKNRFPHDFT